MTGKRVITCKKHHCTGLDSCPECDAEVGYGQYEERYLRVWVRAEASYLKGVETGDNGYPVNRQSSTDPGWDDIFQEIDKKLKSLFSTRIVCGHIEISAEEWE